jgi:hypothetical protein
MDKQEWLRKQETAKHKEPLIMLKARTHFEQVPLAVVKKIVEATGQRVTLVSPRKKIFARHPKVHGNGGR